MACPPVSCVGPDTCQLCSGPRWAPHEGGSVVTGSCPPQHRAHDLKDVFPYLKTYLEARVLVRVGLLACSGLSAGNRASVDELSSASAKEGKEQHGAPYTHHFKP